MWATARPAARWETGGTLISQTSRSLLPEQQRGLEGTQLDADFAEVPVRGLADDLAIAVAVESDTAAMGGLAFGALEAEKIVGVVLGCNGYDIVDLGVMVSCERILQVARDEKVDIIGLSGLITPSLDEMVYVAREMQRQDFHIPLLIGGATTSKAHTAVKIDPQYKNDAVVYVADASRAVGVVTTLLSKDMKPAFIAERRTEYAEVRERINNRQPRGERVPYAKAVAQGVSTDWAAAKPVAPTQPGITVFDHYPLAELVDYFDWTPFFISWDLHGKYPKILQDEVVGEAARSLFSDAQTMLAELIANKTLRARGVIGLWPANRVGSDDIRVWRDAERRDALGDIHCLRQQSEKVSGKPNYSLADFVAPQDSGIADYVGGFAVSIHGADELAEQYEAAGDMYNGILVKALADRFAEALAECLHRRVRKEFWGYAPDETLDNADLIAEKYLGIRPAPGYPACPEHSEKAELFNWLDAPGNAGMQITEHFAMLPASAVSGWYFAHPQATYFNVGKIDRDQVENYAARKGWDMATAERWLAPNLGYDPDRN